MRNKKGRKEKEEKLDVSVHVHEEERKAKERKGHQETKIYKNNYRSQGTQKEQRNAVHVPTNNRYMYWAVYYEPIVTLQHAYTALRIW